MKDNNLNDINIRKMKYSDIQDISKAFVAQNWGERDAVLTRYMRDQEIGDRIVLVAEKNKEIIGYVTLLRFAKNGPFSNFYPEVADFNIFEKYQRMGVGNKLLEEIENCAIQFSNILTLGVGLHKDYGSAQRLYVKRGYIPDGSGVWFNNKNLDINESCLNNDELIIYFSKNLNKIKAKDF